MMNSGNNEVLPLPEKPGAVVLARTGTNTARRLFFKQKDGNWFAIQGGGVYSESSLLDWEAAAVPNVTNILLKGLTEQKRRFFPGK
jgi:hypothetical protein